MVGNPNCQGKARSDPARRVRPRAYNESTLGLLNGIALPLGALRSPGCVPLKRHDPDQSGGRIVRACFAVRIGPLRADTASSNQKLAAENQLCDPGVTQASASNRGSVARLLSGCLARVFGGRTRARTWDPMIKSHLFQGSQEHESGGIPVQQTPNQHYSATEREQTSPNVTLFINVFSISRVALTAHNGLVAGSSPAGSVTSCRAPR